MSPSQWIWVAGLLVGLVGVAALVNAWRPAHRSRLRRLVMPYVLSLVALAAGHAFAYAGEDAWSSGAFIAFELLRTFTLVSVVVLLVFSILLPGVGVMLPMIASDLLVGFGYVVTAFGILSHHGVDPTGALVSGAVVSAVLAISLQSTLGNILGGIALQLDGTIKEGDWIQLENGRQGRVRAVRWRHTVIETRDWSTIVMPNAQLLGASFTLLGKRDGAAAPQRMWVWFNVDFRFAPGRVIQTVRDALCDAPIENVAADPPPSVVCMDLSRDGRESVASYAVRYWLHDLAFDDPTSSRVRARVYTALRRAGIPLAVPAHTAFVELHDEHRATRRAERNLDDRLAALANVHLFKSFQPEELRMLAAGMGHMLYTAGERITRQGAVAHWLYVMTAGSAEIRMRTETQQTVLVATIHAPDFFGEMGLMTGEPRLADVVALGDVDCFRLSKAPFQQVLLGRPEIANELSAKLAERRVELMAAREGLDAVAMTARRESERERILGGIKSFFGL